MTDKKRADQFRRILESPDVIAGIALATLVATPFWLASRYGSNHGRKTFFDKVAQSVRIGSEERARRNLLDRRCQAIFDFFEVGGGNQRLASEGHVRIGPGRPFPDAVVRLESPGGLTRRIAIECSSAGVALQLDYEIRDRDPHLRFVGHDGTVTSGGFRRVDDYLVETTSLKQNFDRETAQTATRLMAVAECPWKVIGFRKPDYRDIRSALFRQHMADNPDLADELGYAPHMSVDDFTSLLRT